MNQLSIHRSAWIEGHSDADDEFHALAQLKISVDAQILTRHLRAFGGGDSDSINVSLLPLAKSFADNWWPLLYEPFRSGAGDAFWARHRLDVPMHGYVFPKVTVCSGGDETLLLTWSQSLLEHSRIEFLTPAPDSPRVLRRDQSEEVLMDLIQEVLRRLERGRPAYDMLSSAWHRLQVSIEDAEELAYCRAAGRLGIDPYDPSSPDLTEFSSLVSESVFEDLTAAAFVEELSATTDWLRQSTNRWHVAPEIPVGDFGDLPFDNLELTAWELGSGAAQVLRASTRRSGDDPRADLEWLFGDVLRAERATFAEAPSSISALISRNDHSARVATVARSAREQRFKTCAAAYIAWASSPGEDRLSTSAFTRQQQASRAFAAELLAPKAYIRRKAPRRGLTSDDIEMLAGQLICPFEAVFWQAYNAKIPLRGIDLPVPKPSLLAD